MPAARHIHGYIAEHQHGTDHMVITVANRCATIGDIVLAAIARDQHRVIGQALYRACSKAANTGIVAG